MCVTCSIKNAWIHHRDNININDALGDYSLTLVDALDSLAVSQCVPYDFILYVSSCVRLWETTVNSNMLSSWS